MLINVIFTGGTIGSRVGGDVVSLAGEPPYELLRGEFSDVKFAVCEPYSLLSEELSAHELCALAKCVRENSDGCDGVIVTHGTDSLVYTSAFLSFVFGGSLPIAVASSGFPLSDPRANGRENFAAAVDFIRSGKRGVAVPWYSGGRTEIHCGARLLRQLPYCDMLVSLGGSKFTLSDENLSGARELSAGKNITCPDERFLAAAFAEIMRLTALPSMCYPDLGGIRAVMIDCYHSGTLCADSRFVQFVRAAKKADVPIFAAGAGGREQEYATVKKYTDIGVFPLPCSSPEAMYVKLALGLANGIGGERLAEFMATPLADEII